MSWLPWPLHSQVTVAGICVCWQWRSQEIVYGGAWVSRRRVRDAEGVEGEGNGEEVWYPPAQSIRGPGGAS